MKRIPGAGNAAMFLQTVPGLIVCVILPLILLIGLRICRAADNQVAAVDLRIHGVRHYDHGQISAHARHLFIMDVAFDN